MRQNSSTSNIHGGQNYKHFIKVALVHGHMTSCANIYFKTNISKGLYIFHTLVHCSIFHGIALV